MCICIRIYVYIHIDVQPAPPMKILFDNDITNCKNLLRGLMPTCQLVDLFKKLLDVIFHLFYLSRVGALTLVSQIQ